MPKHQEWGHAHTPLEEFSSQAPYRSFVMFPGALQTTPEELPREVPLNGTSGSSLVLYKIP